MNLRRLLLLSVLMVGIVGGVSAQSSIDGFEDGDYTSNPAWNVEFGTASNYQVTQASALNGTYGVELNNIGTERHRLTYGSNIAQGERITGWFKVESGSLANLNAFGLIADGAWGSTIQVRQGDIVTNGNYCTEGAVDTGVDYTLGEWVKFGIVNEGGNTQRMLAWDQNGNNIVNITRECMDWDDNIGVSTTAYSGGTNSFSGTLYHDDISFEGYTPQTDPEGSVELIEPQDGGEYFPNTQLDFEANVTSLQNTNNPELVVYDGNTVEETLPVSSTGTVSSSIQYEDGGWMNGSYSTYVELQDGDGTVLDTTQTNSFTVDDRSVNLTNAQVQEVSNGEIVEAGDVVFQVDWETNHPIESLDLSIEGSQVDSTGSRGSIGSVESGTVYFPIENITQDYGYGDISWEVTSTEFVDGLNLGTVSNSFTNIQRTLTVSNGNPDGQNYDYWIAVDDGIPFSWDVSNTPDGMAYSTGKDGNLQFSGSQDDSYSVTDTFPSSSTGSQTWTADAEADSYSVSDSQSYSVNINNPRHEILSTSTLSSVRMIDSSQDYTFDIQYELGESVGVDLTTTTSGLVGQEDIETVTCSRTSSEYVTGGLCEKSYDGTDTLDSTNIEARGVRVKGQDTDVEDTQSFGTVDVYDPQGTTTGPSGDIEYQDRKQNVSFTWDSTEENVTAFLYFNGNNIGNETLEPGEEMTREVEGDVGSNEYYVEVEGETSGDSYTFDTTSFDVADYSLNVSIDEPEFGNSFPLADTPYYYTSQDADREVDVGEYQLDWQTTSWSNKDEALYYGWNTMNLSESGGFDDTQSSDNLLGEDIGGRPVEDDNVGNISITYSHDVVDTSGSVEFIVETHNDTTTTSLGVTAGDSANSETVEYDYNMELNDTLTFDVTNNLDKNLEIEDVTFDNIEDRPREVLGEEFRTVTVTSESVDTSDLEFWFTIDGSNVTALQYRDSVGSSMIYRSHDINLATDMDREGYVATWNEQNRRDTFSLPQGTNSYNESIPDAPRSVEVEENGTTTTVFFFDLNDDVTQEHIAKGGSIHVTDDTLTASADFNYSSNVDFRNFRSISDVETLDTTLKFDSKSNISTDESLYGSEPLRVERLVEDALEVNNLPNEDISGVDVISNDGIVNDSEGRLTWDGSGSQGNITYDVSTIGNTVYIPFNDAEILGTSVGFFLRDGQGNEVELTGGSPREIDLSGDSYPDLNDGTELSILISNEDSWVETEYENDEDSISRNQAINVTNTHTYPINIYVDGELRQSNIDPKESVLVTQNIADSIQLRNFLNQIQSKEVLYTVEASELDDRNITDIDINGSELERGTLTATYHLVDQFDNLRIEERTFEIREDSFRGKFYQFFDNTFQWDDWIPGMLIFLILAIGGMLFLDWKASFLIGSTFGLLASIALLWTGFLPLEVNLVIMVILAGIVTLALRKVIG